MTESTKCRGFRVGDFTLDLRTRTLHRDGKAIALPARAFDALAFLISHRGRVVEKDEIVAAVWRDVAVTDDSLIHAVSVLRRALGDDPARPAFIDTIPRRGYRFIAAVQEEHEPAPTHVVSQLRPSRWGRPLGAAAAAAVLLVSGLVYLTREPALTSARLEQLSPAGTSLLSDGVVSPTGQHLAFVARDEQSGASALWVRALSSGEAHALPGTTAAAKPFWSPDGRTLAFFANGQLHSVPLRGGSPRVIADVRGAFAGGSWGSSGTILFADCTSGLYAVPADGGAARQITRIDHEAVDLWHAWPQFLPDGRHFLYQVVALDGSRAGVFAGSLDSQRSVRLLDASTATFAPPGYLLYVQHEMLMAQAFDVEKLALNGRPVQLANGMSAPSLAEGNVVSGSREWLAFREGAGHHELFWIDRMGAEDGGAIDAPVALSNVRLSPDGRSLLATGSMSDAPGVWLVDLARKRHTRLAAEGLGSVWSPDGRSIAFTARGGRDLHIRATGDTDDTRTVVTDPFVKIVNDWSPDGREMIYAQIDPQSKLDLWAIPVKGGTPVPLLKTQFNEAQARISPDGRWVAYVTDESGTGEVWVRRYPAMTDSRRVSTGGGGQPQWRPDQSELFYLAPDHTLMAIDVGTDGPSGSSRRLFVTPIVGGPSDARDSYAVMPDGKTFLVAGARKGSAMTPITLIRNWAAGLATAAIAGVEPSRSGNAVVMR